MPYGRPLDTSPDNWYEAAKTIDQNQEANEAFQSASPSHPPSCPDKLGQNSPIHYPNSSKNQCWIKERPAPSNLLQVL